MLKGKAYAKINLGLNIKGTLPNGYHDLEMIEVPVDLYDEIMMIESEDFNIISNVSLPAENTVRSAVEVMRNALGFKNNFTVTLKKNIPSQAGLGGGSSDAACVLHLLNEYYRKNLSEEELMELGFKIGADVPFCIGNRPAMIFGAGEKVVPIFIPEGFYALLVKPESGVSTKEAYDTYREVNAVHPDILMLKEALKSGKEDQIDYYMGNSLENPAFLLNKDIENIKLRLRNYGLKCVLMSGSGSTVYSLSKDKENLQRVYNEIKDDYDFAEIVAVNI